MLESKFENHPLFPGEAVPMFISAGPLKEELDLAPFEEIEDPLIIPTLTSGGWTRQVWDGNATSKDPDDHVYYPDRKMMGNARGLPNTGREGMKKLKEPIKRLSDRGIKTIIQVTNLPHEKPLEVIPMMVTEAAELNPTAVEINLSCPNGLDEGGNLHPPTCNNPEVSAEVMSASREEVGWEVCLGAKDSSHATSLESGIDKLTISGLIASAINPYASFLVGINTIGGQSFPEIKCAGGRGGMSGPVIAPIAREWLVEARKALNPKIPILSCGGVDSENAADEIKWRLENGAMLVGGAQEFFRSPQPARLSERWTQAYAYGL